MSCNGCRVLRKGCSESCILRPCLQWMESPEAQGYATVFVAKFFGRAGLMSFISNVPENKRPALFQSLLFEACGRTVNPVSGAAGLLWAGNWSVCQAAVETVLLGGTLSPMLELIGINRTTSATDEFSEAEVTCTDMLRVRDPTKPIFSTSRHNTNKFSARKSKRPDEPTKLKMVDLDFQLMHGFVSKAPVCTKNHMPETRRQYTPSINSEESAARTACLDSVTADQCLKGGGRKLLNLFM